MIPRRLIRTIPAQTSVNAEILWDRATRLHPSWSHITLRDPVDPKLFPITAKSWSRCESGAQKADLIRAEELFARGGVYIDSDYEVFRPFDPLLSVSGWAGYEDDQHICNACMGFRSGHSALGIYLDLALQRLDQGTWQSGVGTITEIFKDRDKDILLLGPDSLYPIHYRLKQMIPVLTVEAIRLDHPWAFGLHHWHHSWEGLS